tara:strand:- start:380 stop:1012 length:633 start_codon:yes stop_codon:yes gene_type:complete
MINYRTLFLLLIGFFNFALHRREPKFIDGELGIVELLQVIFLLLGFIIAFRKRKILIRNSNKFSLFLRLSIFSFLIYEELSFITQNLFNIANEYNTHSEINIHNASMLFVNIKIPFIQFDILLSTIFTIISVMVISFGSYINFLEKINLCFLQRKYCFIGFIYILNIVISVFIRNYTTFESRLIHTEIMELLIYLTLFLDSRDRLIRIKT